MEEDEPTLNAVDSSCQIKKPLKVYSRRNKIDCGRPPRVELPAHTSNDPPTSPIDPVRSDLDMPIVLRKGKRGTSTYPISNITSISHLPQSISSFVSSLSSISIPKTFAKAIAIPRWKKAMDDEMKALLSRNIWTLVILSARKKTMKYHSVYTVKYLMDQLRDLR